MMQTMAKAPLDIRKYRYVVAAGHRFCCFCFFGTKHSLTGTAVTCMPKLTKECHCLTQNSLSKSNVTKTSVVTFH